MRPLNLHFNNPIIAQTVWRKTNNIKSQWHHHVIWISVCGIKSNRRRRRQQRTGVVAAAKSDCYTRRADYFTITELAGMVLNSVAESNQTKGLYPIGCNEVCQNFFPVWCDPYFWLLFPIFDSSAFPVFWII